METAQTLPEFNVGYFNQSIIGLQNVNGEDVYFDSADRFSGFNVGINIPLTFFSNDSKIKSIEIQKQSLQKDAENSKMILQNQLENAVRQYLLYLSKYNLYRASSGNNVDAIMNTATLGFKSGNISYIEYVNALESATDIQLKYLQSINQINQAIININLIINK